MLEVSSGIGIFHDLYTKDANLLKVRTTGINGNVNYLCKLTMQPHALNLMRDPSRPLHQIWIAISSNQQSTLGTSKPSSFSA